MKFPSKVKIGFADYRIDRWAAKESFSRDRRGECCNITNVIRVADGLDDRQAAATLLHEIMHALWWTFKFDNLQAAPAEQDREEPYVSALSSGMATVMRDNPNVFEWVHGALRGD